MAARRPHKAHRAARREDPIFQGVERILDRDSWALDFYHRLLTVPAWWLFVLLGIAYVAFNLAFAGLYLLEPGSIANTGTNRFADSFFFSVQTMATIGYGEMHPATLYANLLVTVEVLLGMTGLAVASGLVFARFSRPTARVMFSNVAVIAEHDGVLSLMFRAANQRRNQILEAQVNVSLLRDEVSSEGVEMRRFHDMAVARSRTPMFALSWTVIHPIDEQSPLFGESRESLLRAHAQVIVSIIGLDPTFSQTVHARHAYDAADLRWNHRLVDILSRAEDGHRSIDYRRFHDTVELRDVEGEKSPPRKVKV